MQNNLEKHIINLLLKHKSLYICKLISEIQNIDKKYKAYDIRTLALSLCDQNICYLDTNMKLRLRIEVYDK